MRNTTKKTMIEIYRYLLPDQLENVLETSINAAFRRKEKNGNAKV
jgi:hypothetical protein